MIASVANGKFVTTNKFKMSSRSIGDLASGDNEGMINKHARRRLSADLS